MIELPQRYDRCEIKATKTPEGFIQDSPVIGRVGIMEYRQPDGSIRREFRPPEEAFSSDSLATLKGKPITVGHPGIVRSDNINGVNPIGTVLSDGIQDGDTIRADMVIYNLNTPNRELSCGYALDTEETPGEWNGQHYDAIQRNIRYNHVAVVQKGRAGPAARLNMDGEQIFEYEEGEKRTMKIRLDNGCEYDVPQEVSAAMDKLRQDKADAEKTKDEIKKQLDKTEAERDDLKSKVAGHAEELKKVKEEAASDADEKVKSRVQTLKKADEFGVENADGMTDREIKEAIIKKARNDDSLDLSKKSEEYIAAAYDFALEDAGKRQDSMAVQRKKVNGDGEGAQPHADEGPATAAEARDLMIENLENAYKGGNE